MKVHLLAGSLPLYQELLANPPKDIEYTQKPNTKDKTIYYSPLNDFKKKTASFLSTHFKLPRMLVIKTDADLIHSTRGILPLTDKNWILELDDPSAFTSYNKLTLESDWCRGLIKKFLIKRNCKKIVCWSQICALSLEQIFHNDVDWPLIKKKLTVMYPATSLFPLKKRKKDGKVRILFTSSLFWEKGGHELLEAFELLCKEYKNLELVMKSDVPLVVKQRFNLKNIRYVPYWNNIVPREQLISELFTQADIYIYPSFVDIFGLGLFDAMVAGLPIVTTDIYAIPEIVHNNKGGIVLRSDSKPNIFVRQLKNAIERLIRNSRLRQKMGQYNRKLVASGKFSLKVRNAQLKQIYEKAHIREVYDNADITAFVPD